MGTDNPNNPNPQPLLRCRLPDYYHSFVLNTTSLSWQHFSPLVAQFSGGVEVIRTCPTLTVYYCAGLHFKFCWTETIALNLILSSLQAYSSYSSGMLDKEDICGRLHIPPPFPINSIYHPNTHDCIINYILGIKIMFIAIIMCIKISLNSPLPRLTQLHNKNPKNWQEWSTIS